MTALTLTLTLIPATTSMLGSLKASLAEIAKASGAATLTVALRANGPKVDGTLVAIAGAVGNVGDTFNARNAKNKAPYGEHLILGLVSFNSDGTVSDVDADLDLDAETRLPMFLIETTSTAEADVDVAPLVADLVDVKRAKDGEVVATGVTRADAEALVAKAKAAKKAALVVA